MFGRLIIQKQKGNDKMNNEQLDILLEEATDIKILIALG